VSTIPIRPRVLLWVQHLVGVGHQRRSAAIARALADVGAKVCYVSGGRAIDNLDLRGCDFVQLAPVRSVDMRYHTLVDEHDESITEPFRNARRDRLLAVFESFKPDVVITETWPFGRGLLRFELEPLMAAVATAQPRPLLVSSIRDIVEHRREPKKFAQMASRVERHFDMVLVHSDQALVRFDDSFPLASRIASRIRYTGYVSERVPVARRTLHPNGPVVVSAGGGFFGERLLRTAIEAYRLCQRGEACDGGKTRLQSWHVLIGPNLPQKQFDQIRAMAPAGVCVERNRSDFHELLAKCAVSVSQGGYNTVVDLLALRVPAVVVPYEDDREREQAVRASRLAALGLVHTVDYRVLAPETLAQAITAVAQGAGMVPMRFNLDGAMQSADLIVQAARDTRHTV
jgi:predicted glycosyltransferase